MLIPPAIVPNTEWFKSPGDFGFEVSSHVALIQSYAKLRLSLHIPRRLIGDLAFSINGRSFFDMQAECDQLQVELAALSLPLNITDDWMLMGKLSGHEVNEFKKISSKSLVTGDYSGMENMIRAINMNSRWKLWPSGAMKRTA